MSKNKGVLHSFCNTPILSVQLVSIIIEFEISAIKAEQKYADACVIMLM